MFDSVSDVEQRPPRCPAEHPWGPNTVLVGWLPCECRRTGGGHRTWQCRTCGAVIYRPEHTGAHGNGAAHRAGQETSWCARW